MSLSTGFSPKPFGIDLEPSPLLDEEALQKICRPRRCVTGSLRWAMQASKSSSKQATALGSSVP